MTDLDRFEPGTLTTRRQQIAMYVRYATTGRVPTWVERALRNRLSVSIVGGSPRAEA